MPEYTADDIANIMLQTPDRPAPLVEKPLIPTSSAFDRLKWRIRALSFKKSGGTFSQAQAELSRSGLRSAVQVSLLNSWIHAVQKAGSNFVEHAADAIIAAKDVGIEGGVASVAEELKADLKAQEDVQCLLRLLEWDDLYDELIDSFNFSSSKNGYLGVSKRLEKGVRGDVLKSARMDFVQAVEKACAEDLDFLTFESEPS